MYLLQMTSLTEFVYLYLIVDIFHIHRLFFFFFCKRKMTFKH
jgi:hypothetical protein